MAGKAIAHETYLNKLKEAWGDEFILLEPYQGGKTPMNHLHVPCGTIKPLRSDHLLGKGKNRRGCRKCNNIRRTHDQFVEEVKAIHGDKIQVIGEYKTRANTIAIIHKKCGKERNPFAGALLTGYEGCRLCSLEKVWESNKTTNEEYVERVNLVHDGDVIPLEEYNGVREYMRHLHVSCGREWSPNPSNVLKGHGCEHCAKESKRLSPEEFSERLFEVYRDEIAWIDGEYVTYKSVLTYKNTKCGHIFDRKAEYMLSPAKRMVNNCPRCSSSKGEARIESYLTALGISYKSEHTFEDCRNINVLPFDFAILNSDETVKLMIEFDGQEHFEPVEYFGGMNKYLKRVANDEIKNEYCAKNEIKLIRIPYWDYDNIETILEEALGLVTA